MIIGFSGEIIERTGMVILFHIEFCEVNSGQAHIEMEMEFVRISSLAMVEPGKLFGISEEKLNLEPELVVVDDFSGL